MACQKKYRSSNSVKRVKIPTSGSHSRLCVSGEAGQKILPPSTTRAHSCVKQQQLWSTSVFWVGEQSEGFSFTSCEPMDVELLPPTHGISRCNRNRPITAHSGHVLPQSVCLGEALALG